MGRESGRIGVSVKEGPEEWIGKRREMGKGVQRRRGQEEDGRYRE